MLTLRTLAIAITGAGVLAGVPFTGAQACDDDRYPSFNFAQHSRCGARPGPAVSEPDYAATRIGRHCVPTGAGRSPSTDRTLAAAFSA